MSAVRQGKGSERAPDAPYLSGSATAFGREILLTRVMIALTALLTTMAFISVAQFLVGDLREQDWFGVATQIVFVLTFAALTYGVFVYFLTRIGHLLRQRDHRAASQAELETWCANDPPSLAVLVPSYKEEPAVVRRTLLSAAFQAYPKRHVVLLIDDPYRPGDAPDAANLAAMRAMPRDLRALFEVAALRFERAHREYLLRRRTATLDPRFESAVLAQLHEVAVTWFEREVEEYEVRDHGDALFVDAVLKQRCSDHRERADRYGRFVATGKLDQAEAAQEYARLATLFRVAFTCFERKRYENLSHEANKAMNLNSYIALMGKSFHEVRDDARDGLLLREVPRGTGTLDFPDADLILTLDADSVLVPDYALRLAHVLGQRGNAKLAVVQTPYSAFPHAPDILERIAGATTDIQYLIHQGFTRYNATFWVGANALLRKVALEDVCTEHEERGHRVRKYIQDRTVIEDTESSIDLADRGWTLCNYPERLAYSATPPDFGALLIQRRRWANGGLIILPKALRYLARGPLGWAKAAETLCRVHYLVSIATTNVAMLILLFGPFERNAHVVWLFLCGLPYIFVYCRDLGRCGYRWSDFMRLCVLNLVLIPIHLGGVFKSLHQAATGKRTPFGRTPKVTGRTAAPAGYVLAEYMLLLGSILSLGLNLYTSHWISAGFSFAYTVACAYAILQFMGLRESVGDLMLWLRPSVSPSDGARALTWDAPHPMPIVASNVPLERSHFVDAAVRRAHFESRTLHSGADD